MALKLHCDWCDTALGGVTHPTDWHPQRPQIWLRQDPLQRPDPGFVFCNWDCAADWLKNRAPDVKQ